MKILNDQILRLKEESLKREENDRIKGVEEFNKAYQIVDEFFKIHNIQIKIIIREPNDFNEWQLWLYYKNNEVGRIKGDLRNIWFSSEYGSDLSEEWLSAVDPLWKNQNISMNSFLFNGVNYLYHIHNYTLNIYNIELGCSDLIMKIGYGITKKSHYNKFHTICVSGKDILLSLNEEHKAVAHAILELIGRENGCEYIMINYYGNSKKYQIMSKFYKENKYYKINRQGLSIFCLDYDMFLCNLNKCLSTYDISNDKLIVSINHSLYKKYGCVEN